jgi:hypothetical protein
MVVVRRELRGKLAHTLRLLGVKEA